MDAFSNTHPNFVDETINLYIDIDSKEIEFFIFASIETFKRQNKKCGKDKVFALIKDALEQTIAMKSFEKILELIQASHSRKCNFISNGTLCPFLKRFHLLKLALKILAA